jgi:YidC/Oxa1 family membrane protein insertase
VPEIHNPDLKSRHTGGHGGFRSLLGILVLVFMLFFGFQYVWHPKPSVPISVGQPQSQVIHAEIAKAPTPVAAGQSVSSSRNFGPLSFIAKPLYMALRLLHDHGIGNWGWSIIVLTVMFNLLIIWPRMSSMKSSLKMMRVQPRIDALRKRYAHLKVNDPKRAEMNTEMMALYQAEGANIFGGCLPLLLQMPLLFAFMSVLRNAAELHQANWLWLTDLSLPDPLHILPLLIIGSMILTQCISPAPAMSSSQRWMFAILMPAVMGFSLWHYASGLSLYWATGNMINLLIQFAINRSKLGKEMHAHAAVRAKIITRTKEN